MQETDSDSLFRRFRSRFWLRPRAHGEMIEDRSVSFLELFYDLVFVVVIAQAAHHLAEHVTWQGAAEFGAIFGLVWLAWLNGTTYHDLHGNQDGRSRTFIFIQMTLIALLAVFTSDAAGETGREFALTYTALMAVLTWLWYTVRREDSEEWNAVTGRYLLGMGFTTAFMAASAFLDDTPRLIAWWAFILFWALSATMIERTAGRTGVSVQVGESLVERFGLFTIIVLGEVVVGVVTGMSDVLDEAEEGVGLAIVTGLLALLIGFATWWTYFDFVGSRLPRPEGEHRMMWMLGHLPASGGIAAAGAAIVSLVEHAGDERAPAGSAWLLTGSLAITLLALVFIMRSLGDYTRLPTLYGPIIRFTLAAAGGILVIGWLRPAPWLLVVAVYLVMSAVWVLAVRGWMSLPDPSIASPNAE